MKYSAAAICSLLFFSAPLIGQDRLPFQHKVETYRSGDGDVAFTVRLEQPFLADEFEKSNFLRLRSSDERAFLIYPKETKFHQKHAEFYGRLKGQGKVKLTLSFETISENLDGSRRVQVREGTIEAAIPPQSPTGDAVGPKSIFLDWARQQNKHFARLLTYYPDETFFQYSLLQSKARYGVDPPPIPRLQPDTTALETGLYEWFTGPLSIQQSLQRATLTSQASLEDANIHVSTLRPPAVKSADYKKLIEQRRDKDRIEPQVQAISKLVPADHYCLHFNSMKSFGEAMDFAADWSDNLFRLWALRAQDSRLQAKLEQQLIIRRDPLTELFADQAIGEIVLTGTDPFLLEGSDASLIFHVTEPAVFRKAAAAWLADARKEHPDLVSRDFNYRGHKVEVHYTNDRVVSSFVVWHEDYVVYSNSHRSIRRIIDVAISTGDSLHDAADFRYVSTVLPPAAAENVGYFFASEAFIRRLHGPAAKISQKRRKECFNNLVMQNNASMLFRLEHQRSPQSLSELIEGRFVDPQRIVCPHGGAYAFDSEKDTCTCSLHNRLRYLTPNAELNVLNVTQREQQQYERYKARYGQFWQQFFNPIAMRISVAPKLKCEVCILPTANSSVYGALKNMLDDQPLSIDTSRIAPSAVTSIALVPGRERSAELLKMIPGIPELVKADPTLTDLGWLGDRMSIHICDGEAILEIDPAQLKTLELPLIGTAPAAWQAIVGTVLTAVNMPIYMTIDVENRDKAERLLEQFSEQIFLKEGKLAGLSTKLDAYELPKYKQHRVYVLSGRVYAVTARLYISLVKDQLVLATKPEILRQVIDVSEQDRPAKESIAHALLRVNPKALDRLRDDVELYWSEKARLSCHRNIISVYNFHKLYDVPIEQVSQLSEAKYGVRYFCPDGGEYSYDADRNQVVCNVHGNREHSRQTPKPNQKPSFVSFAERFNDVTATLRFEEHALIAEVVIDRVVNEEQ